jgi:F-type H+-transporting ATPase subunit a
MAADKSQALEQYISHHMVDGHEWTLLPGVHLPLPPFLSLHGTMVLLTALFLLILFGALYRRQDAVPRGLTNVLELLVAFVRDQIAVPSLGEEDGKRLTPLFCTFFFFILGMNLLGLVPLFATATSNVNVTGALAAVTLVFMIGGAVYKNGPVGFVKSFIPHGVPWPVLLILVPVEFAGVFIKAGALTIRLFANMLAGHIIIFSLLGLLVVYGWVAFPAVALALGIFLLELFVCFLQTYIFTLLSAMFMGQLWHPAH